ncbi:MAG TPA: PspC domain-containing protein [Fibrobacteria bacterium]|nr:PspC domain-containing protein [Fibrobacteria bacterium]
MSAMHRSKDQKIAGVCAGLAESWGIDPSKMRIAVGAVALLGVFSAGISTGFMVLMYLLLWWLLPVKDKDAPSGPPPTGD